MTGTSNTEQRVKAIGGPEYFGEPIYRNMIVLLLERGSTDKSIYCRVIHAHSKFELAKRLFGIEDVRDVTVDVIRAMYRREAGDDPFRPHVRASLADLGTLVLANTGINPCTGALVIDRKLSESSKVERWTEGHRYQDALRRYAEDMRRRGLKEMTVMDNISNLIRTMNRLEELIGPDYSVENMGFDEFLLLRMNSTVSERTCKREIEILRRFIRYLTGKDPLRFKLLWNQTDDFAPNRKFIDSGQWESLVEGVPARTRLILYLGAGMGLRRAEIAKIKLTDIDGRFLTVHGKGHGPEGKVVRLEMPAPVIDAIVDWLPERMEFIRKWGDNSDGRLLINQWRGKGTPMTPGTVGDVVRRLGRERGIEVTAHSLRRLYASTIHKSGVDTDTLRRMMRHVNVQTTLSCYVNADPERMNAARDFVSSALLGAAKA